MNTRQVLSLAGTAVVVGWCLTLAACDADRVEQLEANIQVLEQRLAESEAKLAEARSSASQLESTFNELESSQSALTAAVGDLDDDEGWRDAISDVQSAASYLEAEVMDMQSAIANTVSALN